jgi:hypothetical protein
MLMQRIQQYQNSNTGSLGTGVGSSQGGRSGSAPQF